VKVDGKELAVGNADDARALVDEISKEPFRILDVHKKERVDQPPPPFTTSTLQQQSSTRLHFSASRTMKIAQTLYEGVKIGDEGEIGLITYMRTDSFRVADEAVAECRDHIKRNYGDAYIPEVPPVRGKRKGMQEAHEAIRPTSASRTPDDLRPYLTDDQFKVYRMIWNRFVASQMSPAQYLLTEAQIGAGRALFSAKGREMKFEGYTRVAGHKLREDEQILPSLSAGEAVTLNALEPTQHFTEPPPRYTEASLVKTLEKFGIGRPSTYAPILQTIQDRGYVWQENRKLQPTELGILVTDKLVGHFESLMNTGFTARMEKQLDKIEEGRRPWVKVLSEFYEAFIGDLEKAKDAMESVKAKEPDPPVPCEKCGAPMLEKWNKFGKFLACSKYPECKNAKSLPSPQTAGEKCDKCGADMVMKSGRFGRFLACSKYPECKGTKSLQRGGRKLHVPPGWKEDCDQCTKPMTVRYGRRGAFIACTGYPDCKNTKRVPKEWYQSPQTAAAPGDGSAAPPSAENE
jgi:DNA topoisomerase I